MTSALLGTSWLLHGDSVITNPSIRINCPSKSAHNPGYADSLKYLFGSGSLLLNPRLDPSSAETEAGALEEEARECCSITPWHPTAKHEVLDGCRHSHRRYSGDVGSGAKLGGIDVTIPLISLICIQRAGTMTLVNNSTGTPSQILTSSRARTSKEARACGTGGLVFGIREP